MLHRFAGRTFILAVAMAMAPAAQGATVTVVVDGTDNPFLAGQPDNVTCCSGDAAPQQSPSLAVTGFAPGSLFTFTSANPAAGFLNFPGPVGPLDGSGIFTMTPSHFGIAGAANVPLNALVGVFLNDNVPGGVPPGQRDDGTSFTSLSPDLGQIFFIGDGLTGLGTGSIQQFTAPVGATRLFLGTSDGFGWFNNVGQASITVSFTPAVSAVPEPGTWAMMLAGFAMVGSALRSRRRKIRVTFAR